MDVKYVVIRKNLEFGHMNTMFLFPGWISHGKFCDQNVQEGEKVLSAGFVNLTKQTCYGRSFDLQISSDPEDDKYLKIMYNKED